MTRKEKRVCEMVREELAQATAENAHSYAASRCANFFAALWDSDRGCDCPLLNPFEPLAAALEKVQAEHEKQNALPYRLFLLRYGLDKTVQSLAREIYPKQAEIVLSGL